MLKVPIIRDYYDDGNIYEHKTVTLNPGFTVLVGCNGSGKTTMLHQIEKYCKKSNIPIFVHDNYKHDNKSSWQDFLENGEIGMLATSVQSSEGERISISLSKISYKLGNFIQNNKNSKEVVILLDAIDSGFSVDNIVELKEFLIKTIIQDCKSSGITPYIIASANEYELARGEQCLVAAKCKYVSIKSYDKYRKIVIETRKKKNERYGFDAYEFE